MLCERHQNIPMDVAAKNLSCGKSGSQSNLLAENRCLPPDDSQQKRVSVKDETLEQKKTLYSHNARSMTLEQVGIPLQTFQKSTALMLSSRHEMSFHQQLQVALLFGLMQIVMVTIRALC